MSTGRYEDCPECRVLNLGRGVPMRELFCAKCQPYADHFEMHSALTGEIAEKIIAHGKAKTELINRLREKVES